MSASAPVQLGDIECCEQEAGLDPATLRDTDPAPLIGPHTRPET